MIVRNIIKCPRCGRNALPGSADVLSFRPLGDKPRPLYALETSCFECGQEMKLLIKESLRTWWEQEFVTPNLWSPYRDRDWEDRGRKFSALLAAGLNKSVWVLPS